MGTLPCSIIWLAARCSTKVVHPTVNFRYIKWVGTDGCTHGPHTRKQKERKHAFWWTFCKIDSSQTTKTCEKNRVDTSEEAHEAPCEKHPLPSSRAGREWVVACLPKKELLRKYYTHVHTLYNILNMRDLSKSAWYMDQQNAYGRQLCHARVRHLRACIRSIPIDKNFQTAIIECESYMKTIWSLCEACLKHMKSYLKFMKN